MIEFVRPCIHALTQSCSTGPPRRPRPALSPGLPRNPPAGVFLEGDRLETNDDMRPPQLRLPTGCFPSSWPLFRMDLQGQGQNRQREAQPPSRAALSSRHQTAPQTQGRSGQAGAPAPNRVNPAGQASYQYRLIRASTIENTDCCSTSSLSSRLSRLFSVTCPPCTARLVVLDEKSRLASCNCQSCIG